jgi:Trypsin-like serine proteases, typically periplasmic, contain C-terminal PDZ domain
MYNEFDENNNTENYGTTIDSEVISEEISENTSNSKKPGKGKGFLKLTVYAAVFGLVGGVSFQGYNFAVDKLNGSNQAVVQEQNPITKDAIASTSVTNANNDTAAVTTSSTDSTGSGVSSVVANVMPSIVSITSTSTENQVDMFGRAYQNQSTGSGSGIIIGQNSKEVLIATNNHVVENATKVEVTFSDNKKVAATVKGTDSTADLAVVSVKLSDLAASTKSTIKVATLGNSDNVKVGEMAIAIGNALGYGQSVTVGYISAKDRTVSAEDSSMKLLQTDAAINPGNSGGALLNSKGEVIGINSVKYASEDVEGMGYAIPISTAIPIINQLMNKVDIPKSEQAYLGIIAEDVTDQYSQQFNMPIGIYISQVSNGSPAEDAGLVSGEIIVGFNGKAVTTMEALQNQLSYLKAGETVTITVKVPENGKYVEKKLTVKLGSKADAKDQKQQTQQDNQ